MNMVERNKRILGLRGKKSIAEIAAECGVTYAIVSNVFWRTDHPKPPGIRKIRELGVAAFYAGLTVSDIRALASQRVQP